MYMNYRIQRIIQTFSMVDNCSWHEFETIEYLKLGP
jgi:hypothetical protein